MTISLSSLFSGRTQDGGTPPASPFDAESPVNIDEQIPEVRMHQFTSDIFAPLRADASPVTKQERSAIWHNVLNLMDTDPDRTMSVALELARVENGAKVYNKHAFPDADGSSRLVDHMIKLATASDGVEGVAGVNAISGISEDASPKLKQDTMDKIFAAPVSKTIGYRELLSVGTLLALDSGNKDMQTKALDNLSAAREGQDSSEMANDVSSFNTLNNLRARGATPELRKKSAELLGAWFGIDTKTPPVSFSAVPKPKGH